MHLALAPDDHFMALRIVHDGQRGIFLRQFCESWPELYVVLTLFGLYRNRKHRRVGFDLGNRGMRLLARTQRVTGFGVIELAESDGLATRRLPAFLKMLTHQLEHAGNASGIAGGRGERRAVAGLPAKHRSEERRVGKE